MSDQDWTQTILERIERLKEDGKFYEYHQYFRTVVNKLKRRKEYSFARQILGSAVLYLLCHEQFDSGIDLANLLIDIYILENKMLSKDDLSIFTNITKHISLDCEPRTLFIGKMTDLFQKTEHIDSLNNFLCKYFWEEGSFVRARYRILLSNNGVATGLFIIKYQTEFGLLSEVDLFIAQTVLQYLCLKKEVIAAEAFHTYVTRHPKIHSMPPSEHYPLLNFLWFVLISILNGEDGKVFNFLRKKYQSQIMRDSSFPLYLDDIGSKYFDLKPANPSRNKSPLDNLLGLFGGMDELFGEVSPSQVDQDLCIDEVD